MTNNKINLIKCDNELYDISPDTLDTDEIEDDVFHGQSYTQKQCQSSLCMCVSTNEGRVHGCIFNTDTNWYTTGGMKT